MRLSRLVIRDLRNIAVAELHCSPGLNVVFGDNGSGKTSVLEAIYALGTGRSFRSNKVRPLVRDDQQACVLYADLLSDEGIHTKLGIRKMSGANGGLDARENGKPLRSSSALARLLPVQVVSPEGHRLIEGSPSERRAWIDWSVFHVKHGFSSIWQQYRHALRQRNSWLRSVTGTRNRRSPWDSVLISLAEEVALLRHDVVEELLELTVQIICQLAKELTTDLTLSYFPGWKRGHGLADVLAAGLESDVSAGYTHSGPHRAELRIRFRNRLAVEVLSRGQQKLLMVALRLAQLQQLKMRLGCDGIALFDDLPAELDRGHREAVMRILNELGTQCFVTGTEHEFIPADAWNAVKVFHVKHGQVQEVL